MINASIVLYKHTPEEIASLVATLLSSTKITQLYLIDNSPIRNDGFCQMDVIYVFNGQNLGYGTAHNIALRESISQNATYHLVINPDIALTANALDEIVRYMDSHHTIGLLMPKVYYPNGEIQYVCKLIPTPFDLIFRRFLPSSWSKKRNNRFEMRATGYTTIMDVPYLSGCFMFLRVEALKKVGLFDERFFMYPEDIDLSRRIHSQYRTVFFPEVSIVHHHAQASYIQLNMLLIHIWNLIKYFNKWGWIFDKERKTINAKIMNLIK
jgi:GT2 family glycosyltransferase